ncbi:MAG TPA: endopeptidase La [candidate division Zixibacteria bacterium]|nr:endopeptidase La [candidate division Zixibacteria bacterium]MDD4916750.1 endopeptidase La [candidate division Zixibacteria bacterium]MDM7973809.1 endopeptidase La [candidate division Zixibacteria bacterium]HOD65354.1 endopeptidase La [candidate division Zixibacteria bacterium]HPM37990.1 endopeptidase La [candidate division Zixibacteria bacterium]
MSTFKIVHNGELVTVNSRLCVIPLRDVVVFPHMIYPLLIGREFTVKALREAMEGDRQVLLLAQKVAGVDNPGQEDLYDVGLVARILQVMKMPNGTFKVLVEGLVRACVTSYVRTEDYVQVRISVQPPEEPAHDRELEALSRSVMELFTEYVHLNRRVPDEVLVALASIEQYHQQADTIASHLLVRKEAKQEILELFDVRKQFLELARLLKEEIEILKIEHKIDGDVRESMSRSQREFYLQQQLKAIKDELGQFDEPGAEVDDLYSQLESRDYPETVVEKADEEIKKLAKMHPYSAEAGVIRGYVEWLLALPWNDVTQDRVDFKEVRAILDGDHYGLEKAKQRILEHLAVIRLAGKVRGPILCLVGPPGVGKTSVGRSIARALDRKFVRMSLGGVHDESEIRGHRRTYIGAMPGRIIQGLKRAGSANPVFLLDEIDKIGTDFRGDPAAALLEVLDPEQNNSFSDNYLELECDLSNILFITTANTVATVPPALRDRMEIIRLPGYLDFEKAAIARQFLLPKLVEQIGLQGVAVDFQDEALSLLIRQYTRESGVRELERQMGALLRKAAVEVAEGRKLRRLTVTKRKIYALLGAPKYVDNNIKAEPTIGYAVGLAWTEMGGEVLPVEVAPMAGKAKLTMTGSLGDVMQESATAALSYIRNHAAMFKLKENFFEDIDLHVHLPEGAVPKDGPSAGVTLLIAMLSSLTETPVRTDVAMTGEVTLTGDVLAVGGLNEKLLAAKRMGVLQVILPEKNRKDIRELPADLLKGLKLHYVRSVTEVIRLAMTRNPITRTRVRATYRIARGA